MGNGAENPVGYKRPAAPPAAANSHSASVGRRPPSQMQNASASYQVTQAMGLFSVLASGAALHVARETPASPSHASRARRSVSLTSREVHAPRQPRPAAPPIAP